MVFSRYGPVRLVHINLDGSSAVVYYFSPSDAQRALLELDGKSLNGIQGHLRVRPVSSLRSSALLRPVSLTPGLVSPPLESPVRKYTCRFEIGIENDKDFYVARRLIGPKGAQMKRILLACEGPETPKLRLRGMGSGFLEGAMKQESPEPLHLCISCKDYTNYRRAVDMVADLLGNIYRDYADYCRIRSINRPQPALNYRETPLVSPSPGFTPQPSPSAADLRAGWAHMAGGLSFPALPPGLPVPSVPSLGSSASGGGGGVVGTESLEGEVVNEEEKREILALVEERNAHRARGNYEEADRIRDILRSKGVGLMDEPGGRGRGVEVTSWKLWRSSDRI